MLGEKMGRIEEEEAQAELGATTDAKPKGEQVFISCLLRPYEARNQY